MNFTGCVNLSDSFTWGTNIVNVSGTVYVNENTTLCTDTYSINTTSSEAVLQINSSNIYLDCNNSIMNGVTGNGYGIYMTAKENVTIRNCMATLYTYGMYVASSSKNINITDNFMYNNTGREIAIVGTSGARANNFTLTNNLAWNDTQYGFYMDYVENSTFTNNTAYLNTYYGFYIADSKWNVFQNNNASNNSVGSTNYGGFQFYSSNTNNFTNNTMFGNTGRGIYLYFDNGYNIVENNIAIDNGLRAFDVFSSPYSNFTGNMVNNTNYIYVNGFYTSSCTGCRLVNNYARNCGGGGFSSSDAGIVLINNTASESGGSGNGFVVYSTNCIVVNNTAINTPTSAAFALSGVSNCNISGNFANGTTNGASCFTLSGSSTGVNFTSNTAYNCSGNCFYVSSSSISVTNLTGILCTNYGLTVSGVDYVNVKDVNVSGASHGFDLQWGHYNNITNFITYGNTYGFYLSGANVQNNTFINATTYNNSDTGIYIPSSALDNRFINSSTYDNTQYGIYISQGANLNATNIHAYNNSIAELYFSPWGSTAPDVYIKNLTIDNPLGNFENYTSIDLLQSVAGGFTAYVIEWSNNTYGLPTDMNRSFANKNINITNTTGTPTINQTNFTWLDSEIGGYTESLFKLWKYNASGWTLMDGTPDTANNVLSIENFVPGSLYGIFEGEPTGCANLSDDSTWGTKIVNDTSTGTLYVNENTTLCTDTYHINTSDYVLWLNASNIYLNCNNSVLDGVGSPNTAIIAPYTENDTIENCTIANYGSAFYLLDSSYARVAFNNINNIPTAFSISDVNASNIFNNSINGTDRGIYMYSGSVGNYIYNNTIRNNLSDSSQGIRVENSNSTHLLDNEVRNMSWECAWMTDSAYGIISGNTFDGCGRFANVLFARTNGCNLTNNTIINGTSAALIYMDDSSNSLLEGNEIASGSSGIVITVQTGISENNTLRSNVVHNATTGIYLLYSNYSTLFNNTVYGNTAYGAYLYLGTENVLEHNTFRDNGGIGLYLDGSTSNTIADTTAYNNSNYGIYLASTSTSNNFTNTFIYNQSYYILQQAAAALPNNFTNLTLGYNETIGLVNYPFLNTTDMVLDSSDLILEPYFVSLDDATAPEANLSANVTIYATNCSYPVLRAAGFPVSLVDILADGAIYPTSKSCTDSVASFNVSGFSGYALGRVAPVITLNASPSTPATVGNETNISCYADNAQVTVEIFVNEVSVGSAVERFEYLQNLSVGFYNFTCNTTGNENYTNASGSMAGYEVEKISTSLGLSFVPSDSVSPGTETNVSCTAASPQFNITLYRDGMEVANGTLYLEDIQNLSAGTYEYVCNTTGSANYTSSAVSGTLQVLSPPNPSSSNPSSNNPSEEEPLSIAAPDEVQQGSEMMITVTRDDVTLSGAKVIISFGASTVLTAYTDTWGRVFFTPGNTGLYKIVATKTGFSAANDSFVAVAPAECRSNNDCAYNQECTDGMCGTVPEGECGTYSNHAWEDYACCASSDCGTGFQCTDHECVERETTQGCTIDTECQQGYGCASGTCVPIPVIPTPECTVDNDCQSGFACQNSSCVEITPQPAAQGEETPGAGTPSTQPPPAGIPLWAWALIIILLGAGAYWYFRLRK